MTMTHTDSKWAIGMAPFYPLVRLTVSCSHGYLFNSWWLGLKEVKGTWASSSWACARLYTSLHSFLALPLSSLSPYSSVFLPCPPLFLSHSFPWPQFLFFCDENPDLTSRTGFSSTGHVNQAITAWPLFRNRGNLHWGLTGCQPTIQVQLLWILMATPGISASQVGELRLQKGQLSCQSLCSQWVSRSAESGFELRSLWSYSLSPLSTSIWGKQLRPPKNVWQSSQRSLPDVKCKCNPQQLPAPGNWLYLHPRLALH